MVKTLQPVTTNFLVFNKWNIMRASSDAPVSDESVEESPKFRVAEDTTTISRNPKKPLCGPVIFPELSCEGNADSKEDEVTTTRYTYQTTTINVQTSRPSYIRQNSQQSKALISQVWKRRQPTTAPPSTFTTTESEPGNSQESETVPMVLQFLLRSSYARPNYMQSSSNIRLISPQPVFNPPQPKILRYQDTALQIAEQTLPVKQPLRARIISNRNTSDVRRISRRYTFETESSSQIAVVEGVFEPWLAPRFRDDGQNVRSTRDHTTVTMPHFLGGVVPSAVTPGPEVQKCGNIAVCILQNWDKQRLKKQLKTN